MKKLKCFLVMVMVMVLLLNTIPVSAAANKRMIQEYTAKGSRIELYTYVEEGDKTEYSANLSGINLPAPKVKSTKKNAVTWYILLDVSGSMKGTPFDCAKGVIQTVADNMGEKDNMVIATMGDTILPSPFMSEQEQISSYLAGLEVTNEDTNLYTGIVKSREELASNTSVKTKKCLIILSDGHNDQKKGSTEKEATSTVEDQTVPVFTVATLYDNPSKEANEYADILGSFARESLGGQHYVPVVENISASDVGKNIVENMCKVQKVVFDLADLPNEDLLKLEQKNEDTMTLRLSCLVNGEKSYEDIIEIFRDTLEIKAAKTESEEKVDQVTETPEEKPEETPEETPILTETETKKNETDSDEKTEKEGISVKFVAVFAGIVVLLIVFVILIINRNRKKKEPVKPLEEKAEDIINDDFPIKIDESDENLNNVEISPPAYRIQIVVIGDSSVKFQYLFDINKSFTIGRDDRSDMILIQNDMKLSGQNCRMVYNGKEMYITDISTNGIALEGVKLIKNRPTKLINNSKVRMGSYEYRLNWMRNE